MRSLQYALIAVSTALVPSLCAAADPWDFDPQEPPNYQVARLTADGTVKKQFTTDTLTLKSDCNDPVALPWADESERRPTAALRVRDLRTGKTRIYRCD